MYGTGTVAGVDRTAPHLHSPTMKRGPGRPRKTLGPAQTGQRTLGFNEFQMERGDAADRMDLMEADVATGRRGRRERERWERERWERWIK